MIINLTPLSMAEALKYVKSDSEIRKFMLKFIRDISVKAENLRKNIENLGLMKMKPEYLVKIIDLSPENSESLNKIFNEVSLDEDETKKILQSIRESK